MKLQTLSIVTGLLFVTSLLVHHNQNYRSTDLAAGTDFVRGLDVSKVRKLVLNFKDQQKLTLQREGVKFVLLEHQNFPAASEKINDLMFKIANLQVKEKVASDTTEKEQEKYGLTKALRQYAIELYDGDDKKIAGFVVGKEHKGRGNYLLKEGQKDVYLSDQALWLNTSYKDYISTVLLKLEKDEIQKVDLVAKEPLALVRTGEGFTLERPGLKDYKKEKIDEYLQALTSISFQEFYQQTDAAVRELVFDKLITLQLKNKMAIQLRLAQKGEDFFARLGARVDDLPQKVEFSPLDPQSKVEDISAMLKAQSDAQRINLEKGAWVFKLSKTQYDKLLKDSKFFL